MIRKVVHIESLGNIIITRNKRSRKLRMTVRPDKQVRISIPFFLSFSNAVSFARKNTEWILEQQKKCEPPLMNYCPGSNLRTKFHSISIFEGNGVMKAMKTGKHIDVFVPAGNPGPSFEFIRTIIKRTYRLEATEYLPPRLAELAERFGFSYKRVSIRDNRRNWGSCSSVNNISLNLMIMKLPDELIDYILLHELAHTQEKNHSLRFWNLLNSITGNRARELAKEVRKHSPELI